MSEYEDCYFVKLDVPGFGPHQALTFNGHTSCQVCCGGRADQPSWPCRAALLAENARLAAELAAFAGHGTARAEADWNRDVEPCEHAAAWKAEAMKQRDDAIQNGGLVVVLRRGLAHSEEMRVQNEEKLRAELEVRSTDRTRSLEAIDAAQVQFEKLRAEMAAAKGKCERLQEWLRGVARRHHQSEWHDNPNSFETCTVAWCRQNAAALAAAQAPEGE